jgi:Tetratricopeptide repeat
MLEWIAALGAEEWGIAGGIAGVAAWLGLTPQNARWGWRRLLGKKDEPAEVRLAAPPPTAPVPNSPIGICGLRVGRNVVGREREVAALHAILAPGGVSTGARRVVVRGQGGFGKSTLARHYAEVHGGAFHGGLWTHAGTRQAVIDGLMALCGPLGLPVPDQPQMQHAQAVLAKVRETGEHWLFLYDNVEDFTDIKELIPEGAALIVTTRQGSGWPGWPVQEAGVLGYETPEAPAVRLLLQEAPRGGTAAEAQGLAGDLGGLPLALVVAAGMIREEGGSFTAYRGRLAEVLRQRPQNEDYPTSLLGAVELSYAALDDDARMVADLCAWWAPEGLETALIVEAPTGPKWAKALELIPETLQVLACDPGRVRAAFRALAARSLILSDGAERWTMHRMTAAVLRLMQADARQDRSAAAVGLLAAVYPVKPNFSHNWPLCTRLTPHLLALLSSKAAPGIEALAYLLSQSAIYLDKIADYPGSLVMAQASLELFQALLPEEAPEIAVTRANLGVVLGQVGRLKESEQMLADVVEWGETHCPESVDLAGWYDLHGSRLFYLAGAGRPDLLPKALRRFQQALALNRRLATGPSDAVARTLNNLAAVRWEQGRAAAAERLTKAQLRIWRTILAPEDARLSYGLLNAGIAMLKNRAAHKAEPLLREALDIREAVYAAQPQHPERRASARWLIDCLLRRAQAGENRGVRAMQARQLCDRYGFDFDECQRTAARYPYAPPTA